MTARPTAAVPDGWRVVRLGMWLPRVALPEFLERCTRSQLHRWVASMMRAGAQPNINAAEYSSLRIPLPPLPEQQSIAAALDGVDAAIERARAEAEMLRLVKTATADALLTGRVRVGVSKFSKEAS